NPAFVQPMSVPKDEILFTLSFSAVSDGRLSEMLAVTSEITEAEGYQAEGSDAGEDVSFLDIALVFGQPGVSAPEYALYQNEPNPFSDQTVIGFDLPEAMPATITVFDMHGRIVYELTGDFTQGYNRVVLKSNILNVTGAYYYRLTAGDFTASKKCILTKE